MGKVKYSIVFGGENAFYKMQPFAANVTLKAKSGRYVTYDISDGYFSLTPDGVAKVSGYTDIVISDIATSGDKVPVAMNPHMFATEMPYAAGGSTGTLTDAILLNPTAGLSTAIIGKTIDIYVSSDVQYADDQANDNILFVVGGDVDQNTLYTMVVTSALDQIA